MTLSEANPGQTLEIQKIREGRTLNMREIVRLADLGLVEGHTIHVLRKAPLGDPLEIELLGYQLCLRNEQASCIEVTPKDTQAS